MWQFIYMILTLNWQNSRVVIVEHPRGEEVLSLDDVGRLRVQPLHRHLVPTVRRSVVDAHPHHSPI